MMEISVLLQVYLSIGNWLVLSAPSLWAWLSAALESEPFWPDAAWLMRFPVLSVGAETAPRCVASGIIVSNPFGGFQMSLELFFSFLDMLVLCWKLRETADLQRLLRCICSCNPIGVVFLQNLPFADSQSQSWLREDTGLCRGSVLQCYGLIVGLGNCFSSF